jgi:hypothetical protein
MYSPRQRDLRERRIHQPADDYRAVEEVVTAEADDGLEFESPSGWGIHLSARASAA